MKNKRLFLSLVLVSILAFSSPKLHAQAHAGEYMDELSQIFEPVREQTWSYLVTVVQSNSVKRTQQKRNELIRFVEETAKKIKSMKAWEGDGSIRDSMANFIVLTAQMFRKDFADLEVMEGGTGESFEALDAYLKAKEAANQKYNNAAQNIGIATYAFADKFDITLREAEKDELSLKIERGVETIDYYNKVYRIMFRAQVEESHFITALDAGNIEECKTNLKRLNQFSKSGLADLEKMPPYQGNKLMLIHTKRLLDFYQMEAIQKFPEQIAFLELSEEVAQMKATLESMDAYKRSNQDIDAFNKKVDEFNKGVTLYNANNTSLNEMRTGLINDWNTNGQLFVKTFIKDK